MQARPAGDPPVILETDDVVHANVARIHELDRKMIEDVAVLEVGAGTGTITRKLVDRYPDITVTALEPAENMIGELQSYAALHPRVDVHRETLADYIVPAGGFDAAMYLNVLEHIADDRAELVMAARALRPGGILVARLHAEEDSDRPQHIDIAHHTDQLSGVGRQHWHRTNFLLQQDVHEHCPRRVRQHRNDV